MAKSPNDSHLSERTTGNEHPPLPQHKRMALGEDVSGKSNPYGKDKGPTDDKVHGKNY